MYEPKYGLNVRDARRWHELVVKDALEVLAPSEWLEFKKLERKLERKLNRDPKVRAAKLAARKQDRRIKRLAAKIGALIEKTKI